MALKTSGCSNTPLPNPCDLAVCRQITQVGYDAIMSYSADKFYSDSVTKRTDRQTDRQKHSSQYCTPKCERRRASEMKSVEYSTAQLRKR